jgi:hypothetical protein
MVQYFKMAANEKIDIIPSAEWREFSKLISFPAGVVRVGLRITADVKGAGSVWVDDLRVVKAPVATDVTQ